MAAPGDLDSPVHLSEAYRDIRKGVAPTRAVQAYLDRSPGVYESCRSRDDSRSRFAISDALRENRPLFIGQRLSKKKNDIAIDRVDGPVQNCPVTSKLREGEDG